MADIIVNPNHLLRQKSTPVVFDQNINSLIEKLKNTLTQKEGIKGVGLSAVQIGIPKRVFLAYSKNSKKFLTFINPEIVWYSKTLTNGIPDSKNRFEGCLSVPGLWAIIKRAIIIKIKYQTENGVQQVRKFKGQIATIIQHEYDHLEGILFIDRALQQESKIYQLKKDREGKEYLKEIKI